MHLQISMVSNGAEFNVQVIKHDCDICPLLAVVMGHFHEMSAVTTDRKVLCRKRDSHTHIHTPTLSFSPLMCTHAHLCLCVCRCTYSDFFHRNILTCQHRHSRPTPIPAAPHPSTYTYTHKRACVFVHEAIACQLQFHFLEHLTVGPSKFFFLFLMVT